MKKKAISGSRRAYILTMRILMGAAAVITAALVLFLIVYVLGKGLPHIHKAPSGGLYGGGAVRPAARWLMRNRYSMRFRVARNPVLSVRAQCSYWWRRAAILAHSSWPHAASHHTLTMAAP